MSHDFYPDSDIRQILREVKTIAMIGASPNTVRPSYFVLKYLLGFRDVRWRKNTLVGLFLGVSGMIGLWGIGFFSPELISTALRGAPQDVVDTVRRDLDDAWFPPTRGLKARVERDDGEALRIKDQSASSARAMPWPPPMQRVTSPLVRPSRFMA